MKIVKKFVTVEQFIKIFKRFNGSRPNLEKLSEYGHGDCLCKIINKETNIVTYYFLKKFFIKEIELPYSCNSKIRRGKELVISSMDLSKISL